MAQQFLEISFATAKCHHAIFEATNCSLNALEIDRPNAETRA